MREGRAWDWDSYLDKYRCWPRLGGRIGLRERAFMIEVAVHEAGEPVGRVQRCRRCGFILLPPGASGTSCWPGGRWVSVERGIRGDLVAMATNERPTCNPAGEEGAEEGAHYPNWEERKERDKVYYLREKLAWDIGSPKDADRVEEVIPVILASYRARAEAAEIEVEKLREGLRDIVAAWDFFGVTTNDKAYSAAQVLLGGGGGRV